MRALDLLAYSLVNVLRARRRSVFVLVGLALAVATISTPALALDAQVRALVGRLADSIPYDFHSSGSTNDTENVSIAAASVDGVLGTEPVLLAASGGHLAGIRGPDGREEVRPSFGFAFVRPSFVRFADRFGFSGSFDLGVGEIALADRLVSRIGAAVGDRIQIWDIVSVCEGRPPVCHDENWTANYTLRSVLATPLGPRASTPFELPTASFSREDVAFAGFESLPAMRDDIGLAVEDPPQTVVLVWADRGRLVHPYDARATQDASLRMIRDLAFVALPWGLSFREAVSPDGGMTLAGAVRSVNEALAFQFGLFTLLSVPSFALALLYARIGFETGLARRRRETGILRSRGWSTRELLAALLAEAFLLGAVAAVLGFAMALLVSRVFLGFASASFPGGLPINFAEIPVSPTSVGITVAAAVVGAFVVAFPLVHRASSIRIVRALHVVSPFESAVAYGRASAAALVAVGGVGLLAILGYRGISSAEGPWALLLDLVRTVLIVLSPFLTIVGVARLVSVGPCRPYLALARLVRPWTGDLHFLVAEGLRRHPRRSAHLTMIVAFGLAYAMFVTSLLGVLEVSEVRAARTAVGADLYFESGRVPREDLEALDEGTGVEASAVADLIASSYGTVVAINATDYGRAVPWLDAYYFLEGGPAALATLPSGGAIPDEILARSQGLRIGDPLVVDIFTTRISVRIVVHVAAIVRTLPGLPSSTDMHWPHGSVVLDFDLLKAANVTVYTLAFPGRRAILRAEPGADHHILARDLMDRWDGVAVVFEDVLARTRGNPFRAALFGHLYTQSALAVLVLVVAVSLTAYASGVEREGEFATIAARGVGGKGLAALLFGEGLAVAILGTLLAFPVALVFLAVFIRFLATVQGSVPLEFVVPWPAWALVVGGLAATAAGTALAGLRLRRIDLPRVLKLHGW